MTVPNRSSFERWAGVYNLDDYLFGEVSKRFARNQTLNPRDIFAIVVWKSNRSKTKVKAGLTEAENLWRS